MNELVITNESGHSVTTSTAIADGVEMPHRSVIQLIRQRINDLETFGRVAFEIAPFKTAGGQQTREVALLNEHQSTLLMTFLRNSPLVVEFKTRLVKAFFELAGQQANQSELTRLDLIEMALDSEKKRLRLATEVEELEWQREADRPLVAFAQTVQATAADMDVRRAAQVLANTHGLKIGRQRLFYYLREIRWIGPDGRAYQRAIDQKVLTEKYKTRLNPRTGEQIPYSQVWITSKGLARLQERLSAEIESAA